MNRIKLFVAGGVLLMLAVIGFTTYKNSQFRLVSYEPKKQGSTIAPIIFTFNRKLDEKTLQAFEIQPYTAGRTSIKDRQVVFEPSTKYRLNQAYTAKLKSVTAADGSLLGEQKITFKVAFIPIDKLSESDKAAQMASTDRLEQQNPFLAKLPYQTLEYKIDYDLTSSDKGGVVLTIELYAILNNERQRPAYQQQLQDYKQRALEWMKSQGVDANKYPITFKPNI